MLAIILFLIIALALMLLPYTIPFRIALWTSIFQFYTLPVLGMYPSLMLVANAGMVPKLITLRRIMLQPALFFLLVLIVVQSISLVWSVDRHFGLFTIVNETPFVMMYVVAFHLAQTKRQQLINFLKVYAVLSLLPLFVLVLFALKPQLNFIYIKSWIAPLLDHPHSVQWYIEGYPGESWNGKPRGIIFDPNAAGGYLGICALLFYGLGIYCRSTWLKCVALLHWLGIFFSSVFAAICFGLFFPVFIIFIYLWSEKTRLLGISFRKISFYLFVVLLIGGGLLFYTHPKLIDLCIEKAHSRLYLWQLALTSIADHPFKGLGFGGLEKIYVHLFPPNLDKPLYRPHNTLLALWAQSGLIALLLGIAFIGSVLFSCWRAFVNAPDRAARLFVLFVSSAILWLFLHAMGENWGIVSETHLQAIIATGYGLLMGVFGKRKKDLNIK